MPIPTTSHAELKFKVKKSHIVGVRVPKDFPLNGYALKLVLFKIDTIINNTMDEEVKTLVSELLNYLKEFSKIKKVIKPKGK